MTAPAPHIRTVDALTGTVTGRPSALIRALSEADEFCAELDRVRELECRVDELTAELTQVRAERDDLRRALAKVGGTP